MSNIAYSESAGVEASRRRDDTTYLGAMMNRTAWGAVTAGAIAAISTQMIFTVLGIAIGVSALTAGANADLQEVSMSAGAWWLATGTISLIVGGAIVGRFAGMVRGTDVLLHAFTMWAVTAVFGLALVGNGAGMLSNVMMSRSITTSDTPWSDEAGRRDAMERNAAAAPTETVRRIDDSTTPEATQTLSVAERDRRAMAAGERAQVAAWWTLLGLLVGVGASLTGAWYAPERIVVRPMSA